MAWVKNAYLAVEEEKKTLEKKTDEYFLLCEVGEDWLFIQIMTREEKNKRDLWALRYRDSSDTHNTRKQACASVCAWVCMGVCLCYRRTQKHAGDRKSNRRRTFRGKKTTHTHRKTPLHSTNDETERKRE